MTRRTLFVERPGTEGDITDLVAHQLPAEALERSVDLYRPFGLVRQRRGWAFDGSVADVADNLVTVSRSKFILADVTRTITGDDDGDFFIHNPAGAGTSLFSGSVEYLRRGMYRDEEIWCAQDGESPLIRYSGADSAATVSAGFGDFTEGQATISGWTLSAAPDVGSYQLLRKGVGVYARILVSSTTSITVEDARASVTDADEVSDAPSIFGYAYPCVAVYSAGTISVSGLTATGYGTDWVGGPYTYVFPDAILITPPTGTAQAGSIAAPSNDTTVATTLEDQATKSTYSILRACPFKDVAEHKGSLWGGGVNQFDNRVYCSPIGWNPGFAPGKPLPFDMATNVDRTSVDASDFLLDFVDVPAPYDGDRLIAVLSSPNPLVALMRDAAHGVYGIHGSLSADLLPDGEGAGCIDIRSAWELALGPSWGSEQGVLVYSGGRILNLCKGRIEREWRSMITDFDGGVSDWCTIGEANGVYTVTLMTGGGNTSKTWNVYPFDGGGRLNPSWYPVSNFTPRFMFSSKVPGETEKLLAVANAHQGRVIDFAQALQPEGDALDDGGTGPAAELRLPSNIARLAGANVEERMLEVSVEANITDSGGAGSTLGGSVVSSERMDSDAAITSNLNSMVSKTTDAPKVYRHKVGVKAGLHQIRLAKSATQATETKTEIARIGLTVRASEKKV